MRLSAHADYAVVLLSAAARHCGGLSRVNATALAGETGLPLPTVQKLVSRLSAAGLIESQRGTGGGFRLARPPATITLAEIVEAVEGPIALTACVGGGQDCCVEGSCRVKPHWDGVNAAVRGVMAGVTLAALASPLPLAGGVGGGHPLNPGGDVHVTRVPTPNPSRRREGDAVALAPQVPA